MFVTRSRYRTGATPGVPALARADRGRASSARLPPRSRLILTRRPPPEGTGSGVGVSEIGASGVWASGVRATGALSAASGAGPVPPSIRTGGSSTGRSRSSTQAQRGGTLADDPRQLRRPAPQQGGGLRRDGGEKDGAPLELAALPAEADEMLRQVEIPAVLPERIDEGAVEGVLTLQGVEQGVLGGPAGIRGDPGQHPRAGRRIGGRSILPGPARAAHSAAEPVVASCAAYRASRSIGSWSASRSWTGNGHSPRSPISRRSPAWFIDWWAMTPGRV